MLQPQFKLIFLHPRYWLLWLGLGVLWLTTLLPYKALLFLGKFVGYILFHFAKPRRKIIQRNLDLCFPNKTSLQRKQMLKDNFTSIGIAFFEVPMSWWWSKKRLAKLAKINGLEYLQQAQRNGQGVILMSFHFTSLEIGAALLGQQHEIDGMYRQHNNLVFDYIQRRGRERHNHDASAIERDDIKAMIRILRSGRSIWYAPDQDYGLKNSIFVSFFNIPTATVTATSKFAKLGKALVIPFTQTRLADGSGYQLTIYPPLNDFPSNDQHQDCLIINQLVEQAILKQPEQYLWAHRRFKTRPSGQSSLY